MLFSTVLVVGVYMFARSVESPSLAQASTEAALLQAIAAKDSDGDGLSDWEEQLYGTSPTTTDTFKLGMTDGEAVARGLVVPKAIADIPIATSSPQPSVQTASRLLRRKERSPPHLHKRSSRSFSRRRSRAAAPTSLKNKCKILRTKR